MNIKSLFLSVIAVIGLSATSHAQQMKIAHINSSELMEGLPQIDTIKMQLDGLQKEYEHTLEAIGKELENKQKYWADNPSTDRSVNELRQKEYEELINRYQTAQQKAQQALSVKEAELMQPFVEKLKTVVQEVAKAKGYNYVFDSSEGGGLIYGDPTHDLMIAVKEKLKTTKF